MVTAYVIVTVLAAAANICIATLDFAGHEQVLANMAKVGVPQSSLVPLGTLKVAGGLGILIGIAVPALGVAAAAGLVVFFLGAIVTHVRAQEYASSGYPAAFLLLAVSALVLRLASS